MRKRYIILLLILFSVLLSSCEQEETVSTPEPTLEIINLQILPELEPLTPKISQCANSIEGLGIYTEIVVHNEIDLDKADLVLRLGQRQENDPYVAVMGYEELVLIRGNEVPVSSLSIESIIAIYSGEITNWGDVPELKEQEIDINQPLQTLSYPEGNIVRELFSRSFLKNKPIESDPIIYSTPGGLDRKLKENPYGIAYLLRNQLTDQPDILTITDFDPELAQQLILAITNREPEGKLKQLLLCLQDS